jgi:hypothetical protein
LRAIGSVAAYWSALEVTVLDCIARLSNIRVGDVVILAGPSAFASWMDILMVMATNSKDQEHAHKVEQLEKLGGLLLKLLRLRNYVIHATWMPQTDAPAALGGLLNQPVNLFTSKHKARGFGIPKRGRDVMIFVHWTAPQIRKLASLCARAGRLLGEICDQKKPTSREEQREHARQSRTNLKRIRSMLDSLPDPFRK